MGAITTFVYASWIQAYPQFTNIPEASVEGPILTVAQTYCRNDGGSPITDQNTQTQAFWLMIAHVAQLMFGSTTQPLSPLVGRIASATEGSVSVSLDWPTTPQNAWYLQTPYGAMYWQLLLPYRLGQYAPKTTPLFNPFSRPRFWR